MQLKQSNILLLNALSCCRDAEVCEESFVEVNLASPEGRAFRRSTSIRVNIGGQLGFAWTEGQLTDEELLRQACSEASHGPSGNFTQRGNLPTFVTDFTDNSDLDEAVSQAQAFVKGLDFMLPSLLPERQFQLKVRLLKHNIRLTTRRGDTAGSRLLHFISVNSNQDYPVSAAIYSTQAPESPAELLCRLAWRAVHSYDLAWPEEEHLPSVFTAAASGSLLEDFAEDMLLAPSPECPKPEMRGQEWLHPAINITEDGTLPGAFGTNLFDGEGRPRRPVQLISQGRFLTPLCDLMQARALKIETSGQAVRPWGQPPRSGYANLCLAPGEASLGELCRRVEYGILLDRLLPLPKHMKKPGEFARRCETAFIIQNGRPVCRTPQFVVRANYRDLFGENLIDLGFERTLHGRTLTAPLAVKRCDYEENELDPAETWSDIPGLWW